ncbi:MAG: hypothetical protein KDE19_24165 [Caldilineaceae bacterium]|nr:hypothetical protein [Caldilineaceae bacterium]
MDDELKLHKFSARIAPISVHRPYERQVIFKRVYPVVLHLYDQMTRRQDDRCGFILSSRDTVGEFNFMTAMSACFSRLSLADAE